MHYSILAVTSITTAYTQSDAFGKLIFIAIFAVSLLSWLVIVNKVRLAQSVRLSEKRFTEKFSSFKQNPLGVAESKGEGFDPFSELYQTMRSQTLEILNKNRRDGSETYLSPSDISLVESHLSTAIAEKTRQLSSNLFVLSTAQSLAPFLGLLGTVWGILITFSELTTGAVAGNQAVLGGLAMALATTVLGLVVAIPALIGYGYLRQQVRDFTLDMENMVTEMLVAVEMQYRKVDVHR
jgi:biopolymer transport protein TolQ